MTKNITILGSGIMGHGIAQIAAMSNYNVILRDVEQKFLDNAMKNIKWSLMKLVSKNIITNEQQNDIYGRIIPMIDLRQAVNDTELVIEAIPEIMELKKKSYTELDMLANEDTIFASNTSTLPITEIANITKRPERVIGIHFFNPPQLMKLVEIIPGKNTNKSIIEYATKFAQSLKKEIIICKKDVPGFIVNRLFIPLVHEACHMIDRQNNSILEIDSAVKFKLGFPMGIFELADFTGIDVIHKATLEMKMRDPNVINVNKKIEDLYNQKKLGRKSGEGFYKYNEQQIKMQYSKDLANKCEVFSIVANIVNKIGWLITNDITNMIEIEKAVKLGLGFNMKISEMIDSFGMPTLIKTLDRLSQLYGDAYKPDPYLTIN